MVGLVVATHGRLADELVATAEQIVGKLPPVATCSIEPGTSVEDLRAKMRAGVAEVGPGEGVIVLADLFGGTPCKESLMLCQRRNLEVLAGVNLPMLLKANSLRASVAAAGDGLAAGLAMGSATSPAPPRCCARPEAEAPAARRELDAEPPPGRFETTVISLVRVDNRLIHGQVVEAWLPHLKVARVVVADDEAAGSPLIRAAMALAVQSAIEVLIQPLGAVDFGRCPGTGCARWCWCATWRRCRSRAGTGWRWTS